MNYSPENQTEIRTSGSETKRCPRCAKELPAGAAFCDNCGLNLSAQSAAYQAPAPGVQTVYEDRTPLKTGEYFLILFLAGIPLVGLIFCLVCGFGGESNVNRRNICRAQLILYLISAVVSIAVLVLYIVLFASLFSGAPGAGDIHSFTHGLRALI